MKIDRHLLAISKRTMGGSRNALRGYHLNSFSPPTEADSMNPRKADRAIAPLIGFVLLFGFLIILMGLYQATVVPTENMETELNHNAIVQNDFTEVRAAIVSTGHTGDVRSVPVMLGTTYRGRSVFINPPPPTGTVRTVGTTDGESRLAITNARGSDDIGDFWDGSTHEYSTGTLRYQPHYHEYQNAPTTVYENTILYNRFNNSTDTKSSQVLIKERRVFLVTLNGSVEETRQNSHSVDIQLKSASSTTVVLTDDGDAIQLEFPTSLPLADWQSILDEELAATGSGGHITDLSMTQIPDSSFGLLSITLEPGIEYEFRMTKIGVGQGSTTGAIGYVRGVEGNNSVVPLDGEQKLTAQLRDRYNNPVKAEELRFVTSDGQFADGSMNIVMTTDEQGEASVLFSPSAVGNATVMAGVDTDEDGGVADEPPNNRTTFQLEVRSNSP